MMVCSEIDARLIYRRRCLPERGLASVETRLRLVERGSRRLQVARRNELAECQRLCPTQLLSRVLDVAPERRDVGLGLLLCRHRLLQLLVVLGRIESGNDVAAMDHGVEVGVQRLNHP